MDIKLKYSKIIPFPGYYAITIFNCIYRNVKYRNKPISKITMQHETIHLQQELDFVGGNEKLYIIGGCIFYVLYFLEWLIKLIISGFTLGKVKAYRSISFEIEAFENEKSKNYLENRKRFNWVKNIFKIVRK